MVCVILWTLFLSEDGMEMAARLSGGVLFFLLYGILKLDVQ